jgi:hypothetical protein
LASLEYCVIFGNVYAGDDNRFVESEILQDILGWLL